MKNSIKSLRYNRAEFNGAAKTAIILSPDELFKNAQLKMIGRWLKCSLILGQV